MEDITKNIVDSFYTLPPLLRYPTMVAVAGALAKELPKAEIEHTNACREILKGFFEMIDRR